MQIIQFEHRNDFISTVKICVQNASQRRVFSVKAKNACDVISMFNSE